MGIRGQEYPKPDEEDIDLKTYKLLLVKQRAGSEDAPLGNLHSMISGWRLLCSSDKAWY